MSVGGQEPGYLHSNHLEIILIKIRCSQCQRFLFTMCGIGREHLHFNKDVVTGLES